MNLTSTTTLNMLVFLALVAAASLVLLSPLTAAAQTFKTTDNVRLVYGAVNVNTCFSNASGMVLPNWTDNQSQISGNSLVLNFPAGSLLPGTYYAGYSCYSANWQAGNPLLSTGLIPLTIVNPAKVQLQLGGTSNPFAFTPNLSLTSNKFSVFKSSTYTLTWNYSDPYGTCTASGSGFTGSKPSSGSQSFVWAGPTNVGPHTKTTHSISCQSPGKAPIAAPSVTITHRTYCSPGLLYNNFEEMCLDPKDPLR